MPPEYVAAAGTRFTLGGQPFYVSGVDCYFLAYCRDASRRAVLRTASEMGANVVRSWAFLDCPASAPGRVAFEYFENGEVVRNTRPGGPGVLGRPDRRAAEEAGLYLVLPFVNYRKDFGGIPQCLAWLGNEGGPERFYSDARARGTYRDWVRTLPTRRNTRTGRLYCDEPAILAWELANEPRGACRRRARTAA